MASFCYRIRSTQKNKLVKIQILFTVGRGNQFYVDSQYMVLTDAWDNKRQTVKSRFTFTDDFTEQQGRELTKNLSELRSHILGEIAKDPEHAMTKTRLEKIIYSFHHPRSLTSGRRVRTRESLGDYIARFTREMEEGTRLNIHKLRYGPSTIKNYKGFVVQFDEYWQSQTQAVRLCRHRPEVLRRLRRLVHRQELLRQYDRPPRQGAEDHHARGPRGGSARQRSDREPQVPRADGRRGEHLPDGVGDPGHRRARSLEKPAQGCCRDIFLVGCYTAQRFSDYSTINEGNIRTLENGQQVIDLKQQKTGNHVVIPVRPELQAILEKYDNRLPRTYEQKVNHLIKEIAREAGITEKVEVSYIENGEKKSRLVEKCDLVKTHTARRSGATNMYLAGIPTIAIMKVTGHKTEREFMKYIKITEEQTALELMSHPYFSGASNTTR